MEKLFALLSKTKHAWICALVGFILVIGLQILSFTTQCVDLGFDGYSFGVFFFEVAFCALTILGLAKKNKKWVLFVLCVFKVYDGVHYPLLCLQELGEWKEMTTVHQQIGFIFFVIASILLFVAFVCFVLEHFLEKEVFWNLMKLCLLISAVFMIAGFISYSITIFTDSTRPYRIIYEPLCLAVLNIAMFFGCNYVED